MKHCQGSIVAVYIRSQRLALGLSSYDKNRKLDVSAGAATPHWDRFVFLLLPYISLLCTGIERGSGMVIPEVSVSAETSIAEGGAMLSRDFGMIL